jgi:hypothetical protein
LAAVFCFASQVARDFVVRFEECNVYCPVHWPASEHGDAAVCELAATILTIPADHRYKNADKIESFFVAIRPASVKLWRRSETHN